MKSCASVRECPTTGKSHDGPAAALTHTPCRLAFPDPAVEVWLTPLDIPVHRLHECSLLLSRDEKIRLERMHFERDRRRYTVARAMLRVLLASHVGAAPRDIAFKAGPHGKPYVAAAPVHFNLSHSGERAIYAISRDWVPGVDIEYLDRAVDHAGIAQRFFSVRERAELQRILPGARKRAFLTCWTRKEAVVKATGDGMRLPLDGIEVTVDPDAQPRLLSLPGERTADWILHSVDAGSAYVATVAAHRAMCLRDSSSPP